MWPSMTFPRLGNSILTYTTPSYLFRRLHEIGIRGVHGVPGDYNLIALDYIKPNGLQWVGNCNELK